MGRAALECHPICLLQIIDHEYKNSGPLVSLHVFPGEWMWMVRFGVRAEWPECFPLEHLDRHLGVHHCWRWTDTQTPSILW